MPRTALPAAPEPATRPVGRPVSQEKRQAILEAAIAEFALHGFDAANMDAVAQQAGVSKRTLYNRFGSKDGLFGVLVEELVTRISMSSHIDYKPGADLRRQLLAYVEEQRGLMSKPDNLRLVRAVLAEHIRHPERVEPLLHKYWMTEYGLVEWMKAARKDGRLEGNPETMGHLMGSLMKSILFWPTLLGRASPLDPTGRKHMGEAIDMFLGFYAKA